MEELPGRQALAGKAPEPMLIRSINRATGDERWRMVKAIGRRRRAAPGGQRDRGRDRGQARRTRPALPGRRRARCSPPAWTTSRRWPRSPISSSRELADWCSVALPGGDWLRSRRRRPRRPGQARVRRRLPAALSRRGRRADRRRRRSCATASSQLIGPIEPELLARAIDDPEQREALSGLGMRCGDDRPDGRRRRASSA